MVMDTSSHKLESKDKGYFFLQNLANLISSIWKHILNKYKIEKKKYI